MFRNKEIQVFASIFAGIAIIASAAGFAFQTAAGILVLVSAAAFGAAFFLFTKARYRRLAEIADEIDRVLHNADHLYISETEEGELSILQSEIKKMTVRIREQNHALKQEKEHLSDSLADIAHQLRTPLTSVNLILSLLENEPDENGRKDFLREAEVLLTQMDWLITSLLKLSRLDAGIVVFQNKWMNAEELIKAALRPFLISMELHQIASRIEAPKELKLWCDPNWMQQAIENILKNCVESAGNGGKIEILCQDTLLFTEISIHDSGPGFEEEELPHLFDRFYRGKNTGTAGYGIGLALCKTIITRQGGMVAAKNHHQGGAVFSIRFPK